MSGPSPTAALAGKRVVFVVAGGVRGGAEREALGIASHLHHDVGADVSFCALHGSDGPTRTGAGVAGLPWHVIDTQWSSSSLRNLAALARFAAQVRALRPDVLLPFTNKPNVVCGLTWRATGASLAVWNQRDVIPTRRFDADTFRRALRRSPLVLSCAGHAVDWLVNAWGADPARVHVAYSRAELSPPNMGRRQWRERLGVSEDTLVACMVAHLKAGKHQATAIDAWRPVVDRLGARRRSVLVLAGNDAGLRAGLERQVDELGLRAHVRFLGGVDDVAGLLDASDIAVFCSESELMPHGVTEPMSRGLPVVGNDIPGIREALGPAGERFLAPTGDAARLAELILELVEDEALREAAGRANAALARERHGPAATICYARLVADALIGSADMSRGVS